MEVESVGEKPLDRKKWIILFSVLGVLIVGLIIAIIVVLATRGNEVVSEPISYDSLEEEVRAKYVEATDQIGEAAGDGDYDPAKMLDLYVEKIDEEQDERVKLLLKKDYYYLLSIFGDPNLKDQIMNNLIEIDNKLQMPDTAFVIVNRAKYYGDEELEDEYTKIANDRIGISEEEIEKLREEIEKEAMEEEENEEE